MTSTVPTAPAAGRQRLGRWLARVIGWQVEGALPDFPKFVLIVYPHTSNWDMPIGLIGGYALGLLSGWPYGFMVKDSALRWPVLGSVLRAIGGIGIDRSRNNNAVEQMVAVLGQRERLMLAITPEGTRRRTDYWRTGFYRIAVGARVPIVPAYLDYARSVVGLGPTLHPSGNLEADFEVIREFYRHVTPKFPHEAGEMRLPSENPAAR